MLRTNLALRQASQLRVARFGDNYLPPLSPKAPVRNTAAAPFTLSTVVTRPITVLPHKFSSVTFNQWPVWQQQTSYDFAYIKRLFTTSNTESPLGMSREKLLAIKDKETLLAQLSVIVDSFFPVDNPTNETKIIHINDAIRTAFSSEQTAQDNQGQILANILKPMGIVRKGAHFVVTSNFSLERCSLFHTPNGRKVLSQILRSLHLLGNEQLAKNLQALLVNIALRYAIPPTKITDILLATDPNYWSKRHQATQDGAMAKRLMANFKFTAPHYLPVQKTPPSHLEHNLQLGRTGNLIADYFLGHLPDKNGQHLWHILHAAKGEQLFNANSNIEDLLFPIAISQDTHRCFTVNPLLRSIQRKNVDFVLQHLGLKREGKLMRLQENLSVKELDWLKPNDTQQRRLFLRMVESLNMLDNKLLANNMKKFIDDILLPEHDMSALQILLRNQGIDSPTAERIVALVQQKMPAGPLDHTLKYEIGLDDHQARLILASVCQPEEIDTLMDMREKADKLEQVRLAKAKQRREEYEADKKFDYEHKLALEFSLRDIAKPEYDTLVIGSQIDDTTGKSFDKQRTVFADAGGYSDFNGDIHQSIDQIPANKSFKSVHFTALPGFVFDDPRANLVLFQKINRLMAANGKLVVKFGRGMKHNYDDSKFAQEILAPAGFGHFTFFSQQQYRVDLSAHKLSK